MVDLNSNERDSLAMIEQRFWFSVDFVFWANVRTAISTKFHDTSCIFVHHPQFAPALHTHIDPKLNILPHEAVLFESTIYYNTVCIGLLPMDHHICMPTLVDTWIYVQHVRPENWWGKNQLANFHFIIFAIYFTYTILKWVTQCGKGTTKCRQPRHHIIDFNHFPCYRQCASTPKIYLLLY